MLSFELWLTQIRRMIHEAMDQSGMTVSHVAKLSGVKKRMAKRVLGNGDFRVCDMAAVCCALGIVVVGEDYGR